MLFLWFLFLEVPPPFLIGAFTSECFVGILLSNWVVLNTRLQYLCSQDRINLTVVKRRSVTPMNTPFSMCQLYDRVGNQNTKKGYCAKKNNPKKRTR